MIEKSGLKRLRLLSCLLLFSFLWHCKSRDLSNDQKHVRELSQLSTLMHQDVYDIDIEVVYPFATAATQSVFNSLYISRTGNNANRIDVSGDGHFVHVQNDSVKGNLPFFGESRLSGGVYGGQNAGIVFDSKPKHFEKILDSIKRKLKIKFTTNQNEASSEVYDVTLEIFPNNNVNVNITSSFKTFINYKGVLQTKNQSD